MPKLNLSLDLIAYIKEHHLQNKTIREVAQALINEKFNDVLKQCWLKELGMENLNLVISPEIKPKKPKRHKPTKSKPEPQTNILNSIPEIKEVVEVQPISEPINEPKKEEVLSEVKSDSKIDFSKYKIIARARKISQLIKLLTLGRLARTLFRK